MLNVLRDADTSEIIAYLHGGIDSRPDHEPDPVVRKVTETGAVCDFCLVPNPGMAFLPGKPLLRQTGPIVHDFSSPWASCWRCARPVQRRSLHLLLDGVVARSPMARYLSKREKEELRRQLKPTYREFLATNPKGPFPLE